MAEETKHEHDLGGWGEEKDEDDIGIHPPIIYENDGFDDWTDEDDDDLWVSQSSSQRMQTMIENVASQREAERAHVRENIDLTIRYLNPFIQQIITTRSFPSTLTREFAYDFLALDQEDQLKFVREAIKDPKMSYKKKMFKLWLEQFHPDHEVNASLEGLGWQPFRRMPDYIGESIDEGSFSKEPPTITQDDNLPLFPSTLSQDLIPNYDLRTEMDERVPNQYGYEGISVEALSELDYDLPQGEEVGISQTITNNMFTIPEESQIHKSEVIVHARKLPIYNIPVGAQVEFELQEQLQANSNPSHTLTRRDDGSIDVQVGNSYEDTIRYAGWNMVSETGVGEDEQPILHANYESARDRGRNERRIERRARQRERDLEEAMAFVRLNEPDTWRRL